MQHLANNFIKYIYAKSAGIKDPPLCFIKSKLSTVIDTQIYRNFGSMRTIYSSKWKPDGLPLLPFKNSSEHIKDKRLKEM